MVCKCYDDGRCNGTRERDVCRCNGDEANCRFYAYVRERAASQPSNDFYVKLGDDWHLFKSCVSIRDMVIQVADYTGNSTPLFHTAISGCDESNCIDMYNVFAQNYNNIAGVWKLGVHIFGDKE